MKVALVYDRVNKWGGAERVILALHQLWPEAPLYTAVYSPQKATWARAIKVIPSFLNRLPGAKARHQLYPGLMPLAFESFNFNRYDLVISVTSEAAKGIITQPQTLHLCYCLTPTRYLWSGYNDYFTYLPFRFLAQPLVAYLRCWDKLAGQRPDHYLAISKTVQKRIKKYYQQDAEIVYPGIDTEFFQPDLDGEKNYFLVVSRLESYKKIDLAIKAFNQLGLPLKIIGTGKQLLRLKKIANSNIEFLGQLTDKQLLGYYQNCQAVIFPQKEDFGLVPLEAQACGRPVIAFRAGGARETIVDKTTGLFFTPQTETALAKAVKDFSRLKFNPANCRQQALKFSLNRFKKEFKKAVEQKWKQHQKTFTS